MIHDPLCPLTSCSGLLCSGDGCGCQCDLIAKVREDMLAKCIEAARAVEGGYSVPLGMSAGAFIDAMRHQFIAALCDLEETL